MSEEIVVTRIDDVDLYREARPDTAVWRCCRTCGDGIPASAPQNAYCDVQCKREQMATEMGFGPGSGR